ncbi:hypothetical protein MLD38_025314 [Melastoma candidum]|uniref:Uncharacterized protein n=1 Tax=Melastoma candidum TaxID=119954 RepID=A0ACB9NVX9_9MYRT|nr:hypothetical protein MLD38_025314 [Melastoma candidum]
MKEEEESLSPSPSTQTATKPEVGGEDRRSRGEQRRRGKFEDDVAGREEDEKEEEKEKVVCDAVLQELLEYGQDVTHFQIKAHGKDPQKAVSKTSGPAAIGTGVCAGAYSPLLGTFHALGSIPPYLSASFHNDSGRLRTIDYSDELSGDSLGVLVECDAASNYGSWSGDSEDRKQKGSSLSDHEDSTPGVDSDKREKVRHKNGKKHQRQKERRAQELHDRCRSYLMSRKLDVLVQKLVGMGFPHERATTALILNEGRVEESVAWLFEGSAEHRKPIHDQDSDGHNLRMDISDELAQISMMESRYHCSKQEVERAVVSCQGELERASDMLRTQKQGPSNAKTVDVVDATDCNTISRVPAGPQLRQGTSSSSIQRKDGRDYKSTNTAVDSNGQWESGVKNVQLVKSYQPQLDWAAKHEPSVPRTGKSSTSTGTNSSISYSAAAPVATSASKRVPLYVANGSQIKLRPSGSSAKEPATLTQRLQSTNQKTFFRPLGWLAT